MENATIRMADLDHTVRIADRIIKTDDGLVIRLDNKPETTITSPVANSLIAGITINDLVQAYVVTDNSMGDRTRHILEARDRQQKIVDIICEMFWKEARDRDWCDEATKFMEKFQDRLNSEGMHNLYVDTGEKEYLVEWTETWTVARSERVTASSEDAAREIIDHDHAGVEDISDLRYHSWTFVEHEIDDVSVD